MAKITAKKRRKLPSSSFALPAKRAYPVDTPARAANAKARAKQQLQAGNLSKSSYQQVVAKANKKLKKRKRKPS